MKAEDVRIKDLLQSAKQFIVPIFQRDYSWGTKHCEQLWNDVLRVGRDPNAKSHFLGSIVYIAAEDSTASVTRWTLIDGQQRITTLTLLLIALRDRIARAKAHDDGVPTPEEIADYFLVNRHGKAERKYKLQLRRADHKTLVSLLDGKPLSARASEYLQDNFEFFVERLADADLAAVYRGVLKLVVVDVSLVRGQDDPQMIFESLNSTGLDLTQADLIRNFVLMRQDDAIQTRLYEEYWYPMEEAFGSRYRTDFDKFARDYLTLQLKPSKQLKADDIYLHFRSFFLSVTKTQTVENVLADLKRFGGYYVAFSLGHEKESKLKEPFKRLRQLVEVASPVMLTLYDCFERQKTLSRDEFIEAAALLESYTFRRAVCDMQTRSLGQIFASFAYKIRGKDPLTCLKVVLHRQGKTRRFPNDTEFRQALASRNVFDMRHCHYLLDRLENDSKEKIDTSGFTIEHVLPQNEKLRPEWQKMLGSHWKDLQETWVHRLGNVTLTGYNSEYSDRSFADKKTLKGGFNESPLRLNKFIREADSWTEEEMDARGKALAGKSVRIWQALVVDQKAVRADELEELKARAARYSLDNLGMDLKVRELFNDLRKKILALGSDVVELCNEHSVTYRAADYFVEVIPRKRRLTLLLNLDFEDCEDPTGTAKDATDNAFVVNSIEDGGTLFIVWDKADVGSAMRVVRQAFERVTN